ncbi:expressed unknown protein [Seminavis robusta]|uniref:BZIP domain-containing protein n=1 Tax=Seminavis robusta TaxID=568900 RepID=A0A9N8H7Q1_9STRA|nr:expressed unknown protein [Seminavis robusta]|eukprot:Sro146_g067670.1 n/a (238) ;mRNA; f:85929-86642
MSTKRTQEEMMNGSVDIAGMKASNEASRYDRLEQLKREKRLAMNRECARVRRRRKKVRMEHLESKVQDLTQANGRLQEENEAMLARVAQLEMEVNRARAQRALGMSANSHMLEASAAAGPSSAHMPPSAASLLGGSNAAGASFDLEALTGIKTGHHGLTHSQQQHKSLVDSATASAAAVLERAEKLRYMEMLQARSSASIFARGRDSPSLETSMPLSGVDSRFASSLLANARSGLFY